MDNKNENKLENQIKSENQEIAKKKFLQPAKNFVGKISSKAKSAYDRIYTYLDEKRQAIREEKAFQEKYKKKYKEFMNSYDASKVGTSSIEFEERGSCYNRKITLVTEKGNFINNYFKNGRHVISTYEGFVRDPKNGKWVYAISENETNGWSEIYAREIVRKPNGKFVETDYYKIRNVESRPEVFAAQSDLFTDYCRQYGQDLVKR